MTEPYDQVQRMRAHRLCHDNPGWFVMWGCHSRMFWAFPLMDVASGTLLADPDPAVLVGEMRAAELAAAAMPRPRFAGSSSPGGAATPPPGPPQPPAPRTDTDPRES